MFIHERLDLMRKMTFKEISGLMGMLAPIVAWSSIILAVLVSPWFSFTENYLSDLGGSPESDRLWDTHGTASLIFNFGLLSAGIFGIMFSAGIRKSRMFRTSFGNFGTAIMFLVSGALVGIGLFSETTGIIHTLFSVAFFALVGAALLFLGIDQIRSRDGPRRWFTIGLFLFGLISVPLFMLPKPIGSNAIAEIIPIISVSLFSTIFGFKLYKVS
jgi:hypothetical membrane protein